MRRRNGTPTGRPSPQKPNMTPPPLSSARTKRKTRLRKSINTGRRNLPMLKKKMMICVLMLPMVSAGCASSQPTSPPPSLQPVSTPQAEVPEAAAWAMTPPSNSLQLLDSVFSISAPESSQTKPK